MRVHVGAPRDGTEFHRNMQWMKVLRHQALNNNQSLKIVLLENGQLIYKVL